MCALDFRNTIMLLKKFKILLTNPLSKIQPCAIQALSLKVTFLCNTEYRDNKGMRILLFTPYASQILSSNGSFPLFLVLKYSKFLDTAD